MKTSLYGLLLVVALAPLSARADIALSAPGVASGTQVATKVPFKIEVKLPSVYKFVFTGMEAKGNTLGAPGSSGTNGNGGQFHLTGAATSADDRVKEGGIYFRDEQDYNTSPLVTTTNNPVVFQATTSPIEVTIQWKGEGNSHKPDGFFNILGEYQAAPKAPTGKLSFSNVSSDGYILKGQTPQGTVAITRS